MPASEGGRTEMRSGRSSVRCGTTGRCGTLRSLNALDENAGEWAEDLV